MRNLRRENLKHRERSRKERNAEHKKKGKFLLSAGLVSSAGPGPCSGSGLVSGPGPRSAALLKPAAPPPAGHMTRCV